MKGAKQKFFADMDKENDVIEEEKNTIIVEQVCKTNQFSVAQNFYGAVQDCEEYTNDRKAKNLGLISFYEYTAEQGIRCTHSFLAPNLLACHEN